MTRQVRVRPQAAADLVEAIQWYESRRPGPGAEFLDSVHASIESVRAAPESWPAVHEHVRRTLLRRFPYGIFYIVEGEQIVILALMHARRDPKSWQEREAR